MEPQFQQLLADLLQGRLAKVADFQVMQAATNQYTIIMEIPLELLYAVLPIMGIMMFVRTIMVMHQDWQACQKPRAAKPA